MNKKFDLEGFNDLAADDSFFDTDDFDTLLDLDLDKPFDFDEE